MLDACLAAATLREFISGRGEQVGGGDGLGTIVLPRSIAIGKMEEVFNWPIELKQSWLSFFIPGACSTHTQIPVPEQN